MAEPFLAPAQTHPRRLGRAWSSLPDKKHDHEVAALVKSLVEESRGVRRQEEAHWYVDLRYLANDQWVSWNPHRFGLSSRPKKPWRLRQTINHYRVAIEIVLNVLTTRKPRLNVIPSSIEPEDRLAAKAGEHYLRYLWQMVQTDDLLDDVLMHMLPTGKGILKASWDPDAGPMLDVPTGVLPENVVPGPGYRLPSEPMPIGMMALESISPFSFHIDPSATRLERARWCGSEHYVHIDEARSRWPDFSKKLNPDAGRSAWLNYQRRLLYEGAGAGESASDVQDTITTKELYFRPDGKWQEGRKIVVAGGIVVEDVPSPFGGMFPYVDFTCYPNPGSFWALGLGRLIRNPQTSLNRGRSWFMEMLLKNGNPQWLIAKGAGVSRAALTDEPGNAIYYNAVTQDAVRQLPGQQPPPGWNDLMSADLNDLRELAGVADVMRGVNPPGVRSGRALAYLTEQNLGRHGPLVRRFERSIERLGKLELQIAKKFIAEDRLLQIVGQDGAVEVRALKAADLASCQDVCVVAGSALPESKVARQDFVMELHAQGLLVDDAGRPDAKKAFRLMDFAPEDEFTDGNSADTNWAYEENELMAQGATPMPQPQDNHETHADVIVAFMRTSRFRALPPEIQAIFHQHRDAHVLALQAGETGMPAPGAGGAPGALPPGGNPDERGGASPPGEPRTDMRGGPE